MWRQDTETMDKKPLIQQGWLRALIFVCLAFPLFMLIVLGTDVLMNGMYTSVEITGPVDIVNFLKDYVFKSFSLLIIVWLFRKYLDRQNFQSMGFQLQGYQLDAWTGFFAALMILFIGSLILVANKNLYFTNAFFNPVNILAGIVLYAIVSLIEETVFRGYLLNNLMESMHPWWALLISSILFAVMHIGNDNSNFLSIINIFLASILLSINYIYTRNLWYALFFHFGWNFFQGPVLGYKVSGINTSGSIMQQSLEGSNTLTGGEFGFEGSAICTVLLLIVIILFAWRFSRKPVFDETTADQTE